MENSLIASSLGVTDLNREVLGFIDYARTEMEKAGPVEFVDASDLHVEHRFTPGLYIRTAIDRGPKLIASRLHLREHPFVISRGEALVWSESEGVQALCSHHIGITKPGTYRLIYIPVEVVWTTFHATDLMDPDEIMAAFTINPLTYRLHDRG